MLQTSAVEPHTLALLEQLLELEQLRQFNLVGGTALALRFGHRKSVDLDLFSFEPVDISSLREVLKVRFGDLLREEGKELKFGLFCYIDDVKVDFVRYPHPLIRPVEKIGFVRMASVEDIAAMKIKAILGRGNKKDFFDLVQLLENVSLDKIIQFFSEKYPDNQILISIPSALTWFDDAENSPDPVSLNSTGWDDVKQSIRAAVREYLA